MSQLAGRTDFAALGTGCVVLTTDADRLEPAVLAARTEIELIDQACSRFIPTSDLEQVNNAGGRPVRVAATLLDALEVALDAAEWTDGVVDPTVGRALRLLGYDRDFASIGDGPPVAEFAEMRGWRVVRMDRDRSLVSVPAGVQLDLGATAKALAADRAAAAAASAGGCGVLVSLGGDVSCAGEAPDEGWLVKIAEHHAAGHDAPGPVVAIRDGGVATSSTTVRRWRRGDVDVHHLIDPATGRCADDYWRTVTVAAATCVQANVATTATIVRGEPGLEWLRSLQVPARLVRRDGMVVRVGQWPGESAR